MSDETSKALQLLSLKKNTTFFYGFIPHIYQEYFDDVSGADTDEKIKASTVDKYILTGSMNTSAFDAYRQGVELTRIKHFDAGSSAKIHAGEPGHVLRKNFYGADRNFLKQNAYSDLDYFDPVKYILSDFWPTYPIVTGDNDETENYNFNGVIEPLTIRALISFFSIDVPFEAHDTKAMMMAGNSDITMSTSRILTVDIRNPLHRIVPWLDMIDMVGEVKKIPTMGMFNDDKSFINPFNDEYIGIPLSSNTTGLMKTDVLALKGSTDNYVGENDISATCGWTYDDVWSKGTDSIAFGGLSY